MGVGGLSLYFYSLKLECEKLATEKTEIQRHYVMVSGVAFPFPRVRSERKTNRVGFPWLPVCIWAATPAPEIWLCELTHEMSAAELCLGGFQQRVIAAREGGRERWSCDFTGPQAVRGGEGIERQV